MGIEAKDFFGLHHYEYGEAYFGSYRGMRYRLARDPLQNVVFASPEEREGACLLATVWPEPYAYAKTEEALKTSERFAFSDEGLAAAVSWLNEQYESRRAEWDV